VRRLALALAVLLPQPAAAEQSLVQLVFGLSSEDGRGVSEQEWASFIEASFAPRFSGFTVLGCDGGWFDGVRLIREGCKLVLVLTDRPNHPAVTEAIADYKRRFRQKTVLRLERPCPEESCRFE
jgi:hypothetical protein